MPLWCFFEEGPKFQILFWSACNPYFPPEVSLKEEVVVKDELVEEVLVKEEFAEAGRGVGLLLPGMTLRWIRRWPTPTL